MPTVKDRTGQRYGNLTVIERAKNKIQKSGKSKTMWICLCDCGNYTTVSSDYLQSNSDVTKSCGCVSRNNRILKNRIDNIGEKHGRLTIVDILWDFKPSKAVCECECGNTYVCSKSDVVSGHTLSCGCLQKERASTSNTKDWSGFISGSGIEFVERSYKNKYGQWVWKCRCTCGKYFYDLPARVNNGHTSSCGCKSISFKEGYIKNILSEIGAHYKTEYKFDDCSNVLPLRFDFVLFKDRKHSDVIGAIEYDGEQHYLPVSIFGGSDGLEKCKLRDKIKDDFCSNNNIPLLRLPYYLSEEEIEKKINEYYLSLTTAG